MLSRVIFARTPDNSNKILASLRFWIIVTLLYFKFRGLKMPKPHMGYEEFRSGGLRMNSEHLQGIFNAQRNCQHGRYTAFHLHKKKKPPWPDRTWVLGFEPLSHRGGPHNQGSTVPRRQHTTLFQRDRHRGLRYLNSCKLYSITLDKWRSRKSGNDIKAPFCIPQLISLGSVSRLVDAT